MTNKELREEIARLEAALAELGEKVEALPNGADGGLFKPKNGEDYWSISGLGEVYREVWYCSGRYSIGNCFPTEQSARDTVRVLKLIQKAKESQDGFVPDWGSAQQGKYSLGYESLYNEVCVTYHLLRNMTSTFGYWEDELVCEKFISDNHDELIWFFTEYNR